MHGQIIWKEDPIVNWSPELKAPLCYLVQEKEFINFYMNKSIISTENACLFIVGLQDAIMKSCEH